MLRNPVYQAGPPLDQEVLTKWCPDPAVPTVPPPLADCVVTVPVPGGVGGIVRQGPADSTEQAQAARSDADAHAVAENRYISALEPEVRDFNSESEGHKKSFPCCSSWKSWRVQLLDQSPWKWNQLRKRNPL